MAFHRYLGVTFICTVAFHRLALDRRGNILGGIIGIHPKNDYGRTPIEYAKMYGHSEIVEILYKIQEDILTNHKNQC